MSVVNAVVSLYLTHCTGEPPPLKVVHPEQLLFNDDPISKDAQFQFSLARKMSSLDWSLRGYMVGASHQVDDEEENNEAGSYLATYDWLQTASHQTGLKSEETCWHPEGHRQCMEVSKGQCCKKSCWMLWVQEFLGPEE